MSEDLEIQDVINDKFRDTSHEAIVLAYFLRRKHYLCNSIPPEIFTIDIYKEILKIIKERNIDKIPIHILHKNLLKVIPENQHEIIDAYLEKLKKVSLKKVNSGNIKSFIDDLKVSYESREILNNISLIVDDVDKFDLKKTKELLRKSLLVDASYNVFSSGDYVEDYQERKNEILYFQSNPEKLGICTGIKIFDDLSGGIYRGELAVLMAQTGVGKTMALGNFGLNAYLRGKNILLVSLEMNKHQLQYRLDSRVAKLNHGKFRKASLNNNDFERWGERIKKLKEKVGDHYFEILCLPRGCTANNIQEEAEKIQNKRGKKLDLILIDYINLMSPNRFKGNSIDWANQTETAYELATITVNFNGSDGIPIWTGNQVTDEYKPGHEMKAKHLKYSRGISEVAQVIVGLSQSIDQFLEDGKMILEIIKCRDFPKLDKPIEIYPNKDMMILHDEQLAIAAKLKK